MSACSQCYGSRNASEACFGALDGSTFYMPFSIFWWVWMVMSGYVPHMITPSSVLFNTSYCSYQYFHVLVILIFYFSRIKLTFNHLMGRLYCISTTAVLIGGLANCLLVLFLQLICGAITIIPGGSSYEIMCMPE